MAPVTGKGPVRGPLIRVGTHMAQIWYQKTFGPDKLRRKRPET